MMPDGGRGPCVAMQVRIDRPWHCNCAPRVPRLCECSWRAVRATLELCAVGDAGAEARHAPLRANLRRWHNIGDIRGRVQFVVISVTMCSDKLFHFLCRKMVMNS